MANETEVEVEEPLDLPEVMEGEEDFTDWQAEAKKLQDKAIAQRERTKLLKQQLTEAKGQVKEAVDKLAPPKEESVKTGELDETQLDYLDLKGISEDEDIKIIEDIVKKTGQTVRQALKDEYVISKLESNKEKREVKDATPSSTKRTGKGQTNDVALAVARFHQTGELPDDFELAAAVTNAVADKNNVNKPSWH